MSASDLPSDSKGQSDIKFNLYTLIFQGTAAKMLLEIISLPSIC